MVTFNSTCRYFFYVKTTFLIFYVKTTHLGVNYLQSRLSHPVFVHPTPIQHLSITVLQWESGWTPPASVSGGGGSGGGGGWGVTVTSVCVRWWWCRGWGGTVESCLFFICLLFIYLFIYLYLFIWDFSGSVMSIFHLTPHILPSDHF